MRHAALIHFHREKSRALLWEVRERMGTERWAKLRAEHPKLLEDNFHGPDWGGGKPISIGWDSLGAQKPIFPPFPREWPGRARRA